MAPTICTEKESRVRRIRRRSSSSSVISYVGKITHRRTAVTMRNLLTKSSKVGEVSSSTSAVNNSTATTSTTTTIITNRQSSDKLLSLSSQSSRSLMIYENPNNNNIDIDNDHDMESIQSDDMDLKNSNNLEIYDNVCDEDIDQPSSIDSRNDDSSSFTPPSLSSSSSSSLSSLPLSSSSASSSSSDDDFKSSKHLNSKISLLDISEYKPSRKVIIRSLSPQYDNGDNQQYYNKIKNNNYSRNILEMNNEDDSLLSSRISSLSSTTTTTTTTTTNEFCDKYTKSIILNRKRKHAKGLLEIALKTIKLIKRNQLLQQKLSQLQFETRAFIESVMANPENRALRDKIDNTTKSNE